MPFVLEARPCRPGKVSSIWIWSLCISSRWQGTGVPGHLRWVSSSTARRWLSETARQECCEAPLMGIDVSAITKMSPAYTCIPVCFLAGANLQLSEELSDQTPRSWISLWQALYTEALTPPLTGLAISRTALARECVGWSLLCLVLHSQGHNN